MDFTSLQSGLLWHCSHSFFEKPTNSTLLKATNLLAHMVQVGAAPTWLKTCHLFKHLPQKTEAWANERPILMKEPRSKSYVTRLKNLCVSVSVLSEIFWVADLKTNKCHKAHNASFSFDRYDKVGAECNQSFWQHGKRQTSPRVTLLITLIVNHTKKLSSLVK